MRTRTACLALVLVAMAAAGGNAAPPGESTIDDLNLGTYWFGPEISKKDLLGKVVLVEIYGS